MNFNSDEFMRVFAKCFRISATNEDEWTKEEEKICNFFTSKLAAVRANIDLEEAAQERDKKEKEYEEAANELFGKEQVAEPPSKKRKNGECFFIGKKCMTHKKYCYQF